MPRGRQSSQRPPQDSIDSILLAMSRSESIDDATLAHYLDRLDEEWTRGARHKVLRLFYTSDTAAHAAAVLILSELANEWDVEELEKIIFDANVSDLAKLALSPVLKSVGSNLADDGIVPYLRDAEGAMQQMRNRLLEVAGESELSVESVLEDVLSMPVEKRLGFVDWLGGSRDLRAVNLLIPLLQSTPSRVAIATIDALDQLGAIAAQQTIPALKHLVATSSNRQIKQHARAVLGRLTMQSALGMEDTLADEAQRQSLQFYEARVSLIDGVGAQMIMLSWQRPDGLLKGVNVLYQDTWGIKDCYGTDEMPIESWNEVTSDINVQGLGGFQVSLAYSRAVVAEARVVNKRTRRKLPIAYAIWRPFLEENTPGEQGGQGGQYQVSIALERCELTPAALKMAERGADLYNMPEFFSWMYEPLEDIQNYFGRYWSLDSVMRSRRGRSRKKTQAQPAISAEQEAIITEAITDLVDDKWRSLYENRLRRQGAVIRFAGREADAELIQAVASLLHPDSAVPAAEQPFARAMMRLSFAQGPIRALADALGDGNFSSLPFDLFT